MGTDSPPSLVVQSIVYLNLPADVTRAARAVAHSASLAQASGRISDWTYVVGDCSPQPALKNDASTIEAEIRAAGGEFAYHPFASNLGHGGGHNRLAETRDSDLLLFLNPDGILDPTSITILVDATQNLVGAVDARQLPVEHPKDYDATSGDTSWASGACLMTPRHVYAAIGGFDETFFLYGDDVDYSWRVRRHGHRVVHAPAARMFHDKRLTVSGDWPGTEAELRYSAQASLLLAHKYSRPDRLLRLRKSFSSSGDPYALAALDDFDRRRASGTLPTQIDQGHAVAQFVNGNYATHRY